MPAGSWMTALPQSAQPSSGGGARRRRPSPARAPGRPARRGAGPPRRGGCAAAARAPWPRGRASARRARSRSPARCTAPWSATRARAPVSAARPAGQTGGETAVARPAIAAQRERERERAQASWPLLAGSARELVGCGGLDGVDVLHALLEVELVALLRPRVAPILRRVVQPAVLQRRRLAAITDLDAHPQRSAPVPACCVRPRAPRWRLRCVLLWPPPPPPRLRPRLRPRCHRRRPRRRRSATEGTVETAWMNFVFWLKTIRSP